MKKKDLLKGKDLFFIDKMTNVHEMTNEEKNKIKGGIIPYAIFILPIFRPDERDVPLEA